MASETNYANMGSSAHIDGAKLGILWVFSFALFVGNFSFPICGLLWISTMIFIPFYLGMLTRSYAEKTAQGQIGYWRAYLYSVMVVFYASLIFAIAQWAYFEWIDHDMIINRYLTMLTDPDFKKALDAMGYPKDTATSLSKMIRELRPIDIAIQIMWSNILAGLIMSLTIALYVSLKSHWKPRN